MKRELTGEFHFDGEDPLYQGHFPGNPVVPGSLVVEAFYNRLKTEGLAPLAAKQFRFRAFVPPGTHGYSVCIDTKRAVCTLYCGGTRAVTGEMVLP